MAGLIRSPQQPTLDVIQQRSRASAPGQRSPRMQLRPPRFGNRFTSAATEGRCLPQPLFLAATNAIAAMTAAT
jgi:hypothetical protein